MPVRVVDGLKPVDIKEHEVELLGRLGLADPLRAFAQEHPAVGQIGEGVVVIASDCDGKVNLIAMATDAAMKQGAHAGNLIKAIAGNVGGGGGGRPNMAQAGGKNPAGIPDAIAQAKTALENMLK